MGVFDLFKSGQPDGPKLPLEPGLHHYQRGRDGEKSRVHLRIDQNGKGFLLVNASRILHLNATAISMAYLALEGIPEKQAVSLLTRRYRAPQKQIASDYAQFVDQMNELIRPDGACPICDLNLETTAPFSARPSAPYRMDLAITYRCNNDCAHCYNERSRHFPELSTAEWKKVLERLWDTGIPHIVFTGGEPTLRHDLPELIAHAEGLGQITGLNTNGRLLRDPQYLQSLVDAGLDHVQITLESHDPKIHDEIVRAPGAWDDTIQGIKNALDSRLFVMTNSTLLKQNTAGLAKLLDKLSELGVPTIGLNALIYAGHGLTAGTGLPTRELPPLLKLAHSHTVQHHQKLIWYTPTEYCHFDPVLLDLGVKGCTAALYNMCIEPNGDVIPCQSYYSPLGSILDLDWDAIWNHDLAIRLRERQDVPAKCAACNLLPECGGGCPLERHARVKQSCNTVS